ncbi:uncharacterized protein [Diabrotica undecimpunctata]|uniref:uncharacterized protein n=1 Tax=Diabrotica undecimpunctata TaxID=50387 RepID=UPI003B631A8D
MTGLDLDICNKIITPNMKTVRIIFAALAVAIVRTDEIDDCKCRSLFEPRKDLDGIVRCFLGDSKFPPQECNAPIYPECICTDPATAEPETPKGKNRVPEFKCIQTENDQLIKKGPCENEDDWNKFYEEYPHLKPANNN